MLHNIFLFLVFPGFVFSLTMGLLVGWVDRKVTARIQWRVGPPWYQNFIDIAKLLFYKETLIPNGASKTIFLGMPVLASAAATLGSAIILVANGIHRTSFVGDAIVVVYLLLIPSLAVILGGFSSGNAYASLGASREMKLMLSYELPFILSLAVPVMKAGYVIKLGDIIAYQQAHVPFIASASGLLAFLVMLLCVQAKLCLVPFDMAEAETEIMSGPFVDYSGKALALFKIAKAIATFVLPVLLLTLFFGGVKYGVKGVLKSAWEYIVIVVLLVLIKNTNPRVRIDHALKFFWGPVTAMALTAVVLAYFGY